MTEGEESPAPAAPIKRLTMTQMADRAGEFVARCVLLDGAFAGKTMLLLDDKQVSNHATKITQKSHDSMRHVLAVFTHISTTWRFLHLVNSLDSSEI
jgi:hypothetical protein